MPGERASTKHPSAHHLAPPPNHATTAPSSPSQHSPSASPLFASLSAPRSRPSLHLTHLCLLLVGVGCTLSWTAVVFGSAVYYSERYGRATLLYLSAAVYVPGVLVAAWLASVDGWMYRRLGAVWWTQLRISGGLLLVTLLTLAIPCIPDEPSSEWRLYALTFLLGAACALPTCCAVDIVSSIRKQYIVTLTAGTQLSGLTSLALTLLTSLHTRSGDRGTHRLFLLSAAATTAVSLCAAAVLQWKSPAWQYVMDRRDFFNPRAAQPSEATPLLAPSHDSSSGERWQLTHIPSALQPRRAEDTASDLISLDGDAAEPIVLLPSETVPVAAVPSFHSAQAESDVQALLPAASPKLSSPSPSTLRLVWQPCASLFLTASSSVLLASLYSFAPSSAPGLLLVLVYTRLTLDLVGRLALLLPAVSRALSAGDSPSRGAALLTVAVGRVAVGVALFLAYLAGWLLLSDAVVSVFVGLFSVSSGLLCTLSYQYAAASVSGVNRPSAAHWMNFSFQGSILAGLIAGFVVRFTMLRDV